MKAMLTKYNKKNTLGFSNTVCSKQKKVLKWSLLTWNSNVTTDKSCWRFFLGWIQRNSPDLKTFCYDIRRYCLMTGLPFPPTRSTDGGFTTTANVDKAGSCWRDPAVDTEGLFCVLTLFKLTLLSEVIFRSPFLQLVPREGHCSLRGGGQPLPNPLPSKIGKTLYVIRVRDISLGCVQPCLQVSSATQGSWHVHFG